jgi:hypothetical protein
MLPDGINDTPLDDEPGPLDDCFAHEGPYRSVARPWRSPDAAAKPHRVHELNLWPSVPTRMPVARRRRARRPRGCRVPIGSVGGPCMGPEPLGAHTQPLYPVGGGEWLGQDDTRLPQGYGTVWASGLRTAKDSA